MCAEAAEFGEHAHRRSENPTMTQEVPRYYTGDLSASAEQCAHRRLMPISKAVSKSINSPIGRVEWPMVKNGNVMPAALLSNSAGPSAEALQYPGLVQGDAVALVALDFILRIIRRSTVNVAFIIDGSFMHFDNFSAHTPSFKFSSRDRQL